MALRAFAADTLGAAQRRRSCRHAGSCERCRAIRWNQRCCAIGWTKNHGGHSGIIADRSSLVQREECSRSRGCGDGKDGRQINLGACVDVCRDDRGNECDNFAGTASA